MIKSIRVESFRALRGVAAEMRPLTFLVGPNDSGKTTLLDAMMVLGGQRGSEIGDLWRGDSTAAPHTIAVADADVGKLSLLWHPQGGIARAGPAQSTRLFRLPSDGVAMSSAGISSQQNAPALNLDGSSLASVLDHLLREDRPRFLRIEEEIKRTLRGVEALNIKTPQPAIRQIELTIESGFKVPAANISTGVRLMLFFITLAHHPDPPDVIMVEEPENGVHPRRLKEIVDLLRQITEGKLAGRAAQVIVTTHSPYLLDLADLSQDQVLVFSRQADGRRTAEAADTARLRTFMDEFMLGEVWFNQGEEGLIRRAI